MTQPASPTYLTAKELSERIKYKGVHYIRPFGRRKVLYLWEAIERTMLNGAQHSAANLSMAG